MYSLGTSEEYLGRALRDLDVPRSDVVIATKVNGRMRKAANGAGLSRKAIMTEIDDSLRRLGTDYVDLYQIHRWDPKTPIEETMETLNDLVRSGKCLLPRSIVDVGMALLRPLSTLPNVTVGLSS